MYLQSEVKKTKKKIGLPLAALALLLLCTACIVKGKDLPKGMEEDAVLSAGLGVMDPATDGLGEPKEVTDTMVTGVTDTDEPHAIAVIRRKYEKKSVYFRIAFDPDMELIGMEIKKK